MKSETPRTDAWCELAMHAERDEARLELEKWKTGCLANAADAKDAHAVSDKLRLENLQLRKVADELVDCLQRTHEYIGFQPDDDMEALNTYSELPHVKEKGIKQ